MVCDNKGTSIVYTHADSWSDGWRISSSDDIQEAEARAPLHVSSSGSAASSEVSLEKPKDHLLEKLIKEVMPLV